MANIVAWRKVMIDVVVGLADERQQRRAWFGHRPEQSSPDEAVNMLLGDAAFEEFLQRSDTGLSADQMATGWKLLAAMKEFVAATPEHLSPEVIDHPLWRTVQAVAGDFLEALHDRRTPEAEGNTPTP